MGCANYKIISFSESTQYIEQPLSEGMLFYHILTDFLKVTPIDKGDNLAAKAELAKDMLSHSVRLHKIVLDRYLDQAEKFDSDREVGIFPIYQWRMEEGKRILSKVEYYRYRPSGDQKNNVNFDVIAEILRKQTASMIEEKWQAAIVAHIETLNAQEISISRKNPANDALLFHKLFEEFMSLGIIVDEKCVMSGDGAKFSDRAIQLAREIVDCDILKNDQLIGWLRANLYACIDDNLEKGTIADITHNHCLSQEGTFDEKGLWHKFSEEAKGFGDLSLLKDIDKIAPIPLTLITTRGMAVVDPKRCKRDEAGRPIFDLDYAKTVVLNLIEEYFQFFLHDFTPDKQNILRKKLDFFLASDEKDFDKLILSMKQPLNEKEHGLLTTIMKDRAREITFLKAGYRPEYYPIEYINYVKKQVPMGKWDPEVAKEYLYLSGPYFSLDVRNRLANIENGKELEKTLFSFKPDNEGLMIQLAKSKTLTEAKQIAAKIEGKLASLASTLNP